MYMLSTIYSYQSGGGMGTPTPGLTPPDATQNSNGVMGGGLQQQQQQQNERGDLSSYNQVRVLSYSLHGILMLPHFVSIFDRLRKVILFLLKQIYKRVSSFLQQQQQQLIV